MDLSGMGGRGDTLFPAFSTGNTDSVFKQRQPWALLVPLTFGWRWQGWSETRVPLSPGWLSSFPSAALSGSPGAPGGRPWLVGRLLFLSPSLFYGISSSLAPPQSRGVQGHSCLRPSWCISAFEACPE